MNHSVAIAADHGQVGEGIYFHALNWRGTQLLKMMDFSEPSAPSSVGLLEIEATDLAQVAVDSERSRS